MWMDDICVLWKVTCIVLFADRSKVLQYSGVEKVPGVGTGTERSLQWNIHTEGFEVCTH